MRTIPPPGGSRGLGNLVSAAVTKTYTVICTNVQDTRGSTAGGGTSSLRYRGCGVRIFSDIISIFGNNRQDILPRQADRVPALRTPEKKKLRAKVEKRA